jgi:hypothetical protein
MTPDIERLQKQARKLQWVFSEIEFSLIDDPAYDPWDLRRPKKRLTPDIAANRAAMVATNELISWFAQDSRGFVGLWRGPENYALVDAPIVVLDTEGQYRIRATTVPDYIAVVTRDGVFADVRRDLIVAGFKVARSRDAIYATCDACPDKPNEYRNELYNSFRGITKKESKPSTKKR